MVTVRPATAGDAGRIVALLGQLLGPEDSPTGPETWRTTLLALLATPGRGAALVAEDETGILGVITQSYNLAIRYGGTYAQIEELVVDEAGRGKHVGAALVQAAIAAAREHGCAEIGLYAREHNRPFYEKQGFSYVGPELRLRLAGE
jgi:GNAT superfamily N-acetyltransferase